jgi:hypothetical protein
VSGLPPFSGYDGSCPKCGHADNVTVEYLPAGDVGRNRPPERLRRRCPGCTYEWFELCLDAKAEM